MKKRVLSLLLCFVLAAGLLSVCAPPAQAGTIADAFELFIKQPGQIKKLFNREVAHGDCGPAGDEASVHYKIYEVTNPTVVQDNPFLQQIWQIHDYREDAQYYGVYIFGDGPMADYAATGQKAPWMGNVEVTEYNDKGQVLGTTVVENLGEEYLALAYIADGTDEEWNGRTERYSGVTNVGARAFKDCRYLTCMFLNDDITTISERAFYKDEYLSAINMPRKLELIDKYAFYGCDTLTFVRAQLQPPQAHRGSRVLQLHHARRAAPAGRPDVHRSVGLRVGPHPRSGGYDARPAVEPADDQHGRVRVRQPPQEPQHSGQCHEHR